MYTDVKSVQILISLMKSYGIKHVVVSPGTRAVPFVHSIENDTFFKCYSITDERSAGFFALGLAINLNEYVAVCCTSGTATVNLLSATNEAKYQRIPLLILTAERSLYMLDQYPDQMVQTHDLYKASAKKSVILPRVENEEDEWRCSLTVNQALSDLDNGILGPVNIVFPIHESEVFSFNTKEIKDAIRIRRISYESSMHIWNNKIEALKKAKKILVICGQHKTSSKAFLDILKKFLSVYNCVLITDNISNIHLERSFNINQILSLSAPDSLKTLIPDIVITFGGHSICNCNKILKYSNKETEHWDINIDGDFIDTYKRLTTVFQCSPLYFFNNCVRIINERKTNSTYYDDWVKIKSLYSEPTMDYSDVFVVKKLLHNIPKGSNLHIGNSLSIRYSQFFKIDDSIKIFCNRGVNGIDGTLSTFIGASSETNENQLNFLLIGDLSFFYDMNGLWNRYLRRNLRILLNNNSGGMLFNSHIYWAPYSGVNDFIAAEHNTSAKGWCESCGFKYLFASNEEELNKCFGEFINDSSDKPIILEIFTEKKENDRIFTEYIKKNKEITIERIKNYITKRIKK